MTALSFPYRLGGLAASTMLALALAPIQHAAAAPLPVGDGNAGVVVENAGSENSDIFMSSWTYGTDEVFGSANDEQGQGFWWREGATGPEFDQLTTEPITRGEAPTAPNPPGNVIEALYVLNSHTLDATYVLNDLGNGVSQIVETFVLDILAIDDVEFSFFIWANPDLGPNAGNDIGVLSDPDAVHSNSLYTQTDLDHPGRSYTMKSEVSAISTTDPLGNLTRATTAVVSEVTARNLAYDLLRDGNPTNFTGATTSLGNPGGADPTVVFQYNFFFPGGFSVLGGALTQQVTITMTKQFTSPQPPAAAPEPASLALLAAGGVLLLGAARRGRG